MGFMLNSLIQQSAHKIYFFLSREALGRLLFNSSVASFHMALKNTPRSTNSPITQTGPLLVTTPPPLTDFQLEILYQNKHYFKPIM